MGSDHSATSKTFCQTFYPPIHLSSHLAISPHTEHTLTHHITLYHITLYHIPPYPTMSSPLIQHIITCNNISHHTLSHYIAPFRDLSTTSSTLGKQSPGSAPSTGTGTNAGAGLPSGKPKYLRHPGDVKKIK